MTNRRDLPFRLLSMMALAVAAILLLAACGDDVADTDEPDADDVEDAEDPEDDDDVAAEDDAEPADGLLGELQEAGSVRVGVANEVPFGYVEDGEVRGIAPDVAKEVLAELGIEEMEADVVEFGELIGGLQAGQYDLITAGMYITPDRAAQVFFSDPDYCVQESLAVEEGNPLDISDYQSIVDNPDVTVAVASGTVEVDYAEDAGIPDDQIEIFGDIDGMYRALEAGEVDAVTGTLATVETQAGAREGMEALEGFFPVDADGEEVLPCGGHAFDDEEFRDAFNDVLNEMREDGTTMEIITAYEDFTEEDVELANTLTLEDFTD